MSKTAAWAYDEAEKKIEEALNKVRDGYERDKAIKELLDDPNVANFFGEEELDSVFSFELQDDRMYSNIITKEIQ